MDLTMSKNTLLLNPFLPCVTFCLSLISGCANTSQQTNHSFANDTNLQFLATSFAAQIERSMVGTSFTVSESPWGASTQVKVIERYFAASGRTCVKLNVSDKGLVRVVCQYGQQWALNPELPQMNAQG
jgi:hypothetical protein